MDIQFSTTYPSPSGFVLSVFELKLKVQNQIRVSKEAAFKQLPDILEFWCTLELCVFSSQRHGYCTLGEAFNRLDFSSAIQDIRRFNYVVKLLQLIAKSQLTSLSGAAQKNYFNILDKIVRKVMEDQYNPRLIKDLLQDLSSTLCILIRGVGKSVLVGNINIWICRLETILLWQQQLKNLQMNKQVNNGLTLMDLPLHMLNNILYRFSDGWDIITLGQVTPTLYMLSEDRQLWKKLCQYHFAEKQDTGHPCTASDPNTCLMPVSPQHFIDLFKF
ncbi:F-box only protein 25 [Pitangus sulphuratus]|nr:F-box only protein 25 [Pitangus sulphuratus]